MFPSFHERSKWPESGNDGSTTGTAWWSRKAHVISRSRRQTPMRSTRVRPARAALILLFGLWASILPLPGNGPIAGPQLLAAPVPQDAQPGFRPGQPDDNDSTRNRSATETSPRQPRSNRPVIETPEGVIEKIGPVGLRTYQWDFSRISDKDFDGWPDDFERHFASGFPEYVQIDIQPKDRAYEKQILGVDTAMVLRWPAFRRFVHSLTPDIDLPPLPPSVADYVVDRCLEVRLDGGRARVTTPQLPTKSAFQYHFSVDIKTQNLKHDLVYAEVHFSDAEGKPLTTARTPDVTQTRDWQTVSIEHLVPPVGAESMKVSLNVSGDSDGLQDIHGVVGWDNISFRQYPQMRIETDRPFGVYRNGENVATVTSVLGLSDDMTEDDDSVNLLLRLLDHDGRELRSTKKTVETTSLTSGHNRSKSPRDRRRSPHSDEREVEVKWNLTGLTPGFYRVTAAMGDHSDASLASETTFAVIDRLTDDVREWSPESEEKANAPLQSFGNPNLAMDSLPFGWTLPPGTVTGYQNGKYSGRMIAGWLRDLGVGYARIPAWFLPNDTQRADAVGRLAFRFKDHAIEPVGLLEEPPQAAQEHYRLRERGESGVAAYLHEPAVWRSQLDAIMNRMTFRITKWQLGRDDDFSFQNRGELTAKVNEIASGLQGFGQPLEVVIPWPWMDTPPLVSGESWKGVCRHTRRQLTAQELDAMLDQEAVASRQMSPSAAGDTWMTINPLPRAQYTRDARITDLILRMATARGHKIEAAFIGNPRSPTSGLLTDNGHPDELLLPWRTASLLLGRARNIGSLQLQNNSHNIVFRGSHTSVLMVWSSTPQVERLYLGDGVYQVDVWGRRTEVPTEKVNGRMVHRVEAGPLPTFYVKIDPALAQFRMSVSIVQKRIDALLGKEQTVSVQYTNPVRQMLSGNLGIRTPPQWSTEPSIHSMDLRPNATDTSDFSVVLGNNATIGHFEIPVDFEFATSPPTYIRVYRDLHVGPDGFDLLVTTRLIGNTVRVKVQMTNHTQRRANFDCLIFAGRERQYERRIISLNPGETVYRNVDWPNGEDLIGQQMLLRAIEEDGDRVINHAFEVVR
ncbi:hypothetical protein SAMN06265222_104180 [Neorhodopirellula lusitana]|uniref:Uncharacterized protein n=1 Tax=Neorhodopirellula lusitana TaxID=445327 RepID=A0ABY1Q0K8_9BACT|nr:hypothetical protein [Neorhodopirellula lusitana]SMP53946.1 hypothetical protein SAMN06265222_104180 [Neorhodopirellula lusitana]